MQRIKKNSNKNEAFTLIDILVALTIFAIIAGGIATVIISGIKIWDRARTTDFSTAVTTLALETVAGELRQGSIMPGIPESVWEGTKEEFYLTVIKRDSLLNVGYVYDPAGKVLIRRERALKEAISNKESPYTEKEVMAADEMSFAYFEKGKESSAWLDSWPKEKNSSFCGVRIKWKIKDEEFTKTIFMPASAQ